jgi:hypothetical protein
VRQALLTFHQRGVKSESRLVEAAVIALPQLCPAARSHARPGDNNQKGKPMNRIPVRIVTAAIVGVLAISFAAPSFAQTRSRHVSMPQAQSEYYGGGYGQTEPSHPGAPASVANQPNACFTDEGYGRYASCDQAGD